MTRDARAGYVFDGFRLSAEGTLLVREGEAVPLAPKVLQTLLVLVQHAGEVVRKEDLLKAVWGPGYGRESNYLRVYGNQLRRKLEADPSRPRHILTEPGIGYRLVE